MTLLIATPVRGAELFPSTVSLGYAETRARLAQRMPVEFLDPALCFSCDNVRGRNRIASKILREFDRATHVLWWDDDNWPMDVSIVDRMLAARTDMIGGGYTNKRQPLRWIHQEIVGQPKPIGDLLEVARCGFGFTITSRECLRRMFDTSDKYIDLLPGGGRETVANMFGMMMADIGNGDRTLLSEDYSFCDRWRALGGRIWMYNGPGNGISHGGGHEWNGHQMVDSVSASRPPAP